MKNIQPANLKNLKNNFYQLDIQGSSPDSWRKVKLGDKEFVYATIYDSETKRKYEEVFFLVSSDSRKVLLYAIQGGREVMELDAALKKSIDRKVEMNELILEGLKDLIHTEADNVTRRVYLDMGREVSKISGRTH